MIKVRVLDNELFKVEVIDNRPVNVSVISAIDAGGSVLPYEGEYEVTPKVYNPVVLHTDGLRMLEDVTVFKIPQYEVSNLSGGKTLIIGDDYN